jgi:hypothetical protein
MITPRADEIVACYWAVGPTYRTYLAKNIQETLKNSPEMFKFIILTDHVTDSLFAELKNSEKCLAILDINEERKPWPWSFEFEVIAKAKTDLEYGSEFKHNLYAPVPKKFSYSLNRFVIPWLIRNNVTKFFIIDPDVHLCVHRFNSLQKYVDEVLYEHPVLNSRLDRGEDTPTNKELYESGTSRVVGIQSSMVRKPINDLMHDLICSVIDEKIPYPEKYPQLDGQIKFYDFDTVQSLERFFNVWNETRRIEMLPENLRTVGAHHGPVIMNDEVLLGGIFFALKINVYVWLSNQSHYSRPRIENRWFEIIFADYKVAQSLESSMEKNRHMYQSDLYDFSEVYRS